ncbi:anti-repressor SinI family protein [Rossellomorea sp. BNER]|uniref:anti-repressor SinI family protein n=1 Tax=Rossellomorea sp. BNER TaxID=2962031 RepID=UPI003AF2713D|nr:anti-repressor SinI family protein [Rossellomorea sp. BNER]
MNSVEGVPRENLDEEWLSLILTARQIGLTIEEVREFIKQSQETVPEIKKSYPK